MKKAARQKLIGFFYLLSIVFAASAMVTAQKAVSKVWVADLGNGFYKNPIIHADYSDPDVIRVGEDYYMTASSFNATPGLPILRSKDLVNWRIINHVFTEQTPSEVFRKPQHGNGVWAPAIRYRKGEFYIYYGDPDFGIYLTKTTNPAGAWEKPILIKEAKGWIDACPFWDDDGRAYLVHAFAGSRAGIKSVLVINRLNAAGAKILDNGVLVFDGHDVHPTIEGPKLYKRNGYYYIFAPAGGVTNGWQLALRAKNIFGPYEERVVLAQGKTAINGPHQGAWVDTPSGESWFIHFQDKGAYGRITHLQPMVWKNDFPVIGIDADNDRIGEPVLTYRKPNVGRSFPITTPQDSDEFNENSLGLQWQWHANAQSTWAFPFGAKGALRMFSVPLAEDFKNFWDAPNLLLQKFPAPKFTATAKITFTPRFAGEKFGLIVMGSDYAYLSVTYRDGKLFASQSVCLNADKQGQEATTEPTEISEKTFFLRVDIDSVDGLDKDAAGKFSFSLDGKNFHSLGPSFKAQAGRWIGAKLGLFFIRTGKTNDGGSADVDWFRFE